MLVSCGRSRDGSLSRRWAHRLRPRGARAAPEGLSRSLERKEGQDQDHNLLDVCEAQSKGITVPASSRAKDPDIALSGFPSPDPDPGASAPVAEEPVFVHPKQVGMLYSVARKLGKPISDEEALRFDDMPHEKKKWILDPMLASWFFVT